MTFTAYELMKCAERELALRRAVYAKRDASTYTPAHKREIAMMEAIVDHFMGLVAEDLHLRERV
jgi:hypothetical protein